MSKLLYGVCGIGMGHTLRQTPIIDHFARHARVVVFAFGESYRFLTARFRAVDSVDVLQVSVPFYVGGRQGLDFAATARRRGNFAEDSLSINCAAMEKARRAIGTPDLVVSDYEPVAAQYAYAAGAPLVTIDQQSKYLVGQFPQTLNGEGFADEVERLRMFFPQAKARIACSFFKVPRRQDAQERVQLMPPILTGKVRSLRPRRKASNEVLVYISSQQKFCQSAEEIGAVLSSQAAWKFHVFLPQQVSAPSAVPANVTYFAAGDPGWYDALDTCSGIITTAGHSLLCEAMHLRKPVYAMPLPVYEQQMNAHTIDTGGFGIARPQLTVPNLAEFLGALPQFTAAIKNDRKVLLRGSADQRIINYLSRNFLA